MTQVTDMIIPGHPLSGVRPHIAPWFTVSNGFEPWDYHVMNHLQLDEIQLT